MKKSIIYKLASNQEQMIELPEARTTARDLKKEILGKKILDVRGNFTDHKFTFYYKDPNEYKKLLVGKKITDIIERNYYVEIEIEDYKLDVRDGVETRYYENKELSPKKSKLLLEFDDGSFLNFTVIMYGFISVSKKNDDMDKYYRQELDGIGAISEKFSLDYFKNLINKETEKLSAKAFLATKQRILGLGNGVLQDILFNAKISPKTKIKDLSEKQINELYDSIVNTIKEMIDKNGRDTEKNIYGTYGNYKTIMSAKNYKEGCPNCRNEIKKENYLGGSVYYCTKCQIN